MTRCQRPFFAALPGYPESVLVPLEARPDFAPLDDHDEQSRRGCQSQARYVVEHTHRGGTDAWHACGAHLRAMLGARKGQTVEQMLRYDFGPSIVVRALPDAA